jgi:hypothetical protein
LLYETGKKSVAGLVKVYSLFVGKLKAGNNDLNVNYAVFCLRVMIKSIALKTGLYDSENVYCIVKPLKP